TLAPVTGKDAPATDPTEGTSYLARLFEHYAPALRAFLVRRLGNIEDAREATQDVFLNLWRQPKGLLKGDPGPYLFASAENWVRDCRRKAVTHVLDQHEPLDGSERQGLIADQLDSEETVYWRQGLELVVECIRELPAQTQLIFNLYHGSTMSYTEIAEEL